MSALDGLRHEWGADSMADFCTHCGDAYWELREHPTCMVRVEAALTEANERADRTRAMLRRVEWADHPDDMAICYVCYRNDKEGHLFDCELAALLKEAP